MALDVRVNNHVSLNILFGMTGERALWTFVIYIFGVHNPQMLRQSRFTFKGFTTVLACKIFGVGVNRAVNIKVSASQRLIVTSFCLTEPS